MDNMVHLLWFVNEMPEGEDIELLIGVYASESEAQAAIERVKNGRGLSAFPQGFEIHQYQLNRDHWTDGFIID